MLLIFWAVQAMWCFTSCALAAFLPILVWELSSQVFHLCSLSLLNEEFILKLYSCCWCDGSYIICCMWQITNILRTNFWIAVVVEHDKWLSLGTEKSCYSFIIRVKQNELPNLLVPSDMFAILSAIANIQHSNRNITG